MIKYLNNLESPKLILVSQKEQYAIQRKDVSKYWGQLWTSQEGGLTYDQKNKDFLNKFKFDRVKYYLGKIKSPHTAKVLEVGSGDGYWLRRIREIYPKAKLYGLDIAEESKKIAGKYGVSVKLGDIISSPYPDESFDFIMSWGVIEHFHDKENTRRAIGEHIRMLKVGGIAMIDCPNTLYLGTLEYHVGNILFHHRTKHEIIVTKGRAYTNAQLRNYAFSFPYKIKIISEGNGPILPLYKFLRRIDHVLPRFMRYAFGGGTCIIVQRLA